MVLLFLLSNHPSRRAPLPARRGPAPAPAAPPGPRAAGACWPYALVVGVMAGLALSELWGG